ncbi:MAG TPA: hypothetical protein VNN22_06470 [Verrucomicrobiae bacterium]|nr:hypothetical protein [Verrucomicrobiae bacterium]
MTGTIATRTIAASRSVTLNGTTVKKLNGSGVNDAFSAVSQDGGALKSSLDAFMKKNSFIQSLSRLSVAGKPSPQTWFNM